ncbi:MAG: cupin domain-containing protein [Firmicutes bacterium]|nr:cupin domain-containing protein [Bacillota bacterium]
MIRNFYEVTPDLVENIHDGEGIVKVSTIFDKFTTPMQFLHYTVLPPGTSIGVHKHGSDEEFYIILEGTGEMELDGTKQAVAPGDVIRNAPFGSHGLRNLSDKDDLKILVFEVKQ